MIIQEKGTIVTVTDEVAEATTELVQLTGKRPHYCATKVDNSGVKT